MTRYDLLELRDTFLHFYDGLNSNSKKILELTGRPGSINIRTTGPNLHVVFDKLFSSLLY